ncbi:MAG: hypothetical protein QNI87_06720 [Erythrobacter sp.]|uniref:hypothetical protein n=1 Tax=Erythrobacter sp. TaxID=1042 RepID=UPI002608EBFD|nr:hypothetical protein [Erythrobacter sp.]MDJ0978210.1 hypothetical protein [Erythrobacter sp.]
MDMPLWAGVFGLVTCMVFLVNAVRELRRGEEGHARNAAMIHVGMVSMFLPFSVVVIITSLV